jgi:hypothetical protein
MFEIARSGCLNFCECTVFHEFSQRSIPLKLLFFCIFLNDKFWKKYWQAKNFKMTSKFNMTAIFVFVDMFVFVIYQTIFFSSKAFHCFTVSYINSISSWIFQRKVSMPKFTDMIEKKNNSVNFNSIYMFTITRMLISNIYKISTKICIEMQYNS